jgi:hypothetical protein
MKYYQNFLTIDLPMLNDCKIMSDNFNVELF